MGAATYGWQNDRHYSLNSKSWSATVEHYMFMHIGLAQKYSVGLQEIFVSRLCSEEENSLPCWILNNVVQCWIRILNQTKPDLTFSTTMADITEHIALKRAQKCCMILDQHIDFVSTGL
jgi:hypothetical protein